MTLINHINWLWYYMLIFLKQNNIFELFLGIDPINWSNQLIEIHIQLASRKEDHICILCWWTGGAGGQVISSLTWTSIMNKDEHSTFWTLINCLSVTAIWYVILISTSSSNYISYVHKIKMHTYMHHQKVHGHLHNSTCKRFIIVQRCVSTVSVMQ